MGLSGWNSSGRPAKFLTTFRLRQKFEIRESESALLFFWVGFCYTYFQWRKCATLVYAIRPDLLGLNNRPM